jgi:hypothetical protein
MMVQSANALFFRVKMRQAINGAFSAILLTVNLPAVAPGRPKWLASYRTKKPTPCVSGEFLKKISIRRDKPDTEYGHVDMQTGGPGGIASSLWQLTAF